jgi:hypothetical protein
MIIEVGVIGWRDFGFSVSPLTTGAAPTESKVPPANDSHLYYHYIQLFLISHTEIVDCPSKTSTVVTTVKASFEEWDVARYIAYRAGAAPTESKVPPANDSHLYYHYIQLFLISHDVTKTREATGAANAPLNAIMRILILQHPAKAFDESRTYIGSSPLLSLYSTISDIARCHKEPIYVRLSSNALAGC